jgi:predicted AAA+ superfamily ATPase
MLDIGILNCLLDIPGEAILGGSMGTYKGFILENFVAQELFSATNTDLVSWQEGTAELEFLVAHGADIVPVEVKSAPRNRRSKSLDAYIARYKPSRAFKLTRQNLGLDRSRGITTAPVYCSARLGIGPR